MSWRSLLAITAAVCAACLAMHVHLARVDAEEATTPELGGDAPPPLEKGSGFQCGDTVTLRIAQRPDTAAGVGLEIESTNEGSNVPPGGIDLFGNIRRLLDEEGFAGKWSHGGALLPAPGA